MSKRGRARLWITLVLVGAATAAGATYYFAISTGLERRAERLALQPDESVSGLSLPEFRLTDAFGRERTREDLRGRIVVMDFLFTNCPFICPSLSANMRLLQERLEGVDGVLLVSVSVDPEHDTPEALRAYGERIGADPERWWFLTGEFEAVRRISEEGFKLALSLDPGTQVPLGGGKSMDNVLHTGKFVVVGPDGRVITMASGLERDEVERLAERLVKAAKRLEGLRGLRSRSGEQGG